MCQGCARSKMSGILPAVQSSADLRKIQEKINGPVGWESLDQSEREAWEVSFLLDVKVGDFVVYINMPEYGKCTLARVSKDYFFDWGLDGDFNHRLGIEIDSLRSFDRNDELVHPSLSARLKLQRRWWHVSTKQEFADLLAALEMPSTGRLRTSGSALLLLHREVAPLLEEVVKKIQHTHPGKDLEVPIAEILKRVPGITDVQVRRGRQDVIGADITFDYDGGLPIAGLQTAGRCAVQVKSYEGELGYKRAVEDIDKAFKSDSSFTNGLIVSTALRMTRDFEDARDALFKK